MRLKRSLETAEEKIGKLKTEQKVLSPKNTENKFERQWSLSNLRDDVK